MVRGRGGDVEQPFIVFDFTEKRVYQTGKVPKKDLSKALSEALAIQRKSKMTVGAVPAPPKRKK